MTELNRRKRARASLLRFTEYTKRNYRTAAVHAKVAHELDLVLRGYTKRLIIDAPPRHGKSELFSRRMPALAMGQKTWRPPGEMQYISASYGAALANSFGREVRNLVNSGAYKALFPDTHLSEDSTAKSGWHTTQGGSYLAVGVGTAITGFGADILGIDDPIKGRKEAESEIVREGVWAWYKGDAYTRLQPDAAIVITATRWHEDDLVGKLLEEEKTGGDEWKKLILPAIDEKGEALWPEAYGVDYLARVRRVIGDYDWHALYEQAPRPMGGAFFNMDDLLVLGQPLGLPPVVQAVYAIIDSATKTGKQHDGTGVTFFATLKGLGQPYTVVILDWDYVQIEGAMLMTWLPSVYRRLEELARECRARAGSLGAWIEDKSSGMVLLQQATNANLQARPIDSKLTAMGKVERAIDCSGYVRGGQIKMCQPAYDRTLIYKGVSRNHLVSQILGFRVGSKDDAADDLLDTFTYGIILGLGNPQGF